MKNIASTKSWSIDIGLLLLRLSSGLMLLHGWSKYTNFAEASKDWPDPFHIGMVTSYSLTVFAELVCPIFVALGLFTRVFLIPLIILMLIIVFIIDGGSPLEDREHGLMYLFLFLSLLFTGPGKYSIDRLIQRS